MSKKSLFKQCPNCQQFTPEKNSVCMHCEHQFVPPEVPLKKKWRTCGIWVLGVLAVIGLVFVAAVISVALSNISSTPASATRSALSTRETAPRRTAVAVHTDTPRPATNTPTPSLVEPTATNPPTVSRFIVTGNIVNVRRGPDTTFDIIGTVNQGMQFDIIGKNQPGDWYQFCCVNDEQGWIFGELVEVENLLVANITSVPSAATVVLPTATSVPPTSTSVPTIPRLTVSGDAINVRQGPGTNYPVIGQVNEGMKFIINAKNQKGNWYRFCCIKQKSGWIYAPLVDVENPQLITLTVITPTPPPPALDSATPVPPTAAQETYVREIQPSLNLLLTGTQGAAPMLKSPDIGNEDWEFDLAFYLGSIRAAYQLALEISPPASLQNVHNEYVEALEQCDLATLLIANGIDNLDAKKMERAGEFFQACASDIRSTQQLLEKAIPSLQN